MAFHDYMFNEIKLVFDNAKHKTQDALHALSYLTWFLCNQNMPEKFYLDIKAYLIPYLQNDEPKIRRYSFEYILDCYDYSHLEPTVEEKSIHQQAINDNNLKNKVYAYKGLRDMNLIPDGFKFSSWEKFKLSWKRIKI